MNSTLLGIIEFEKDPPHYGQFLQYFAGWAQDAGGFAGLALLFLVLFQLTAAGSNRQIRFNLAMKVLTALAFAGYAFYFAILLFGNSFKTRAQMLTDGVDQKSAKFLRFSREGIDDLRYDVLFYTGLAAILAFAMPCLVDMVHMRWRRIYALSRLSFTEAVRRRVLWGFLPFFIVFLFPAKWFFQIKPEDELRTTVQVVYLVLEALLLLVALTLPAFSIPNDIKNQTIHTVVTKPVERFEILLGRFLGMVALLSVSLFGLTLLSYVFIRASSIDDLSKTDSMRARIPKYGTLEFQSKKSDFVGIDVGREKTYRKYIAGGPSSTNRGLYWFDSVSGLTDQKAVPCEFAFDIYKLTKGEENRGIYTTFDFKSWRYDPATEAEYEAAARPYRNLQDTGSEQWAKLNEVAEKYGRYEYRFFPLLNYHTYAIQVPPGLFKHAAVGAPPKRPYRSRDGRTTEIEQRLVVSVKCESPSQMLGLAQYDLYFLESEGSFSANYFKGIVGLWCKLVLIIGLALVWSTYLAGVISMLGAGFLFFIGYFLDFLVSLATHQNVGGGPMESLSRLVKGDVAAAPLDKTALTSVLLGLDDIFRWTVRRVFNVIPDIDKFAWTDYVSEGFSVPPELMVMNGTFLVGYLIPWFLAGYYIMKTREIAA